VASRQTDFGLRCAARTHFVGHQYVGREAVPLEELAHRFVGRGLVAPSLHEQVENPTFVVNRAPQPELPPAITAAISSRCQRDVGRGRLRRSSQAKVGPNFNTHRRTVS
jgi:hypothetical protein